MNGSFVVTGQYRERSHCQCQRSHDKVVVDETFDFGNRNGQKERSGFGGERNSS